MPFHRQPEATVMSEQCDRESLIAERSSRLPTSFEASAVRRNRATHPDVSHSKATAKRTEEVAAVLKVAVATSAAERTIDLALPEMTMRR